MSEVVVQLDETLLFLAVNPTELCMFRSLDALIAGTDKRRQQFYILGTCI